MTITPEPLEARPLAVANQWLKSQERVTDLCGNRIAPTLDPVLPAIRLTNIGPIERGPEEVKARVQIECWAATYDEAEALALAVVSVVPMARNEWPAGYCAGGSVESGPFDSPDPTSEKFRLQLDVGLWTYPNLA